MARAKNRSHWLDKALPEPEVIVRKPGESDPLDRYREGVAQGRADILALVAKLPSPVLLDRYLSRSVCGWCRTSWTPTQEHPDNGCLWPRAQQAASEERS